MGTISISSIKLRLFVIYTAIALFLAVGMIVSNVVVSGYPPERVLLTVQGLAVGITLQLILLHGYTRYRLKGMHAPASNEETLSGWWSQLMWLPSRLSWIVLAYGVVATQAFQLTAMQLDGGQTAYGPEQVNYWRSTLFNVSTYAAIAVLHYAVIRRTLRPQIRKLGVTRVEHYRFRSIVRPLLLTLVLAITYGAVRLWWYAFDSRSAGNPLHDGMIVALILVPFSVGAAVFYAVSSSFFSDLKSVAEKLRELARVRRGQLLERIPILSGYETGQLVSSFNGLQKRFEREYERLDRDLQLARSVQMRLLEPGERRYGEWRMAGAYRRSMEVGGGVYDMVPLDGNRVALMAGNVSGTGIPAALIVSALLMMFRMKARSGVQPGRLLRELNVSLADILTGTMQVHLAVVYLDTVTMELELASAGDACVRVATHRSGGGTEQTQASTGCTPPLGGSPSYPYEGTDIHDADVKEVLLQPFPMHKEAGGGRHPAFAGLFNTDTPLPVRLEQYLNSYTGTGERLAPEGDLACLLAYRRGEEPDAAVE